MNYPQSFEMRRQGEDRCPQLLVQVGENGTSNGKSMLQQTRLWLRHTPQRIDRHAIIEIEGYRAVGKRGQKYHESIALNRNSALQIAMELAPELRQLVELLRAQPIYDLNSPAGKAIDLANSITEAMR